MRLQSIGHHPRVGGRAIWKWNTLAGRNLVLLLLLTIVVVAAARSADFVRTYDDLPFANLTSYEMTEAGCKAQKATNLEACVRSKIGPNFSKLPINAPDRYISDEQRPAIPNRQAGPNLVASSLNDRALGVQFQVTECRVVAAITEQQRHNIFKVANPGLKTALQPAEFDLEEVAGKFWLSVINLSTLAPDSARAMACLARLRVALETGDPARVAAERCEGPAARQTKPLSSDNLKGKLGKLFRPETRDAPQSKAPSQLPQADPCLTQPPGGSAAGEPTSSAAASSTRPPAVNPFDVIRQSPGTTSATAGAPGAGAVPKVLVDSLPGLPTAPKDAVMADLVSRPDLNDPEMRELLEIAAALVTPQGINGSQRPQERDTVYRPLAEFLARERPQQRWAEIVGRATILLQGAYLRGTDGRPQPSMEQAFGKTSGSSGFKKITAVPTLELMKILIGTESPSAAQDSFAPRAIKANPMDLLFRVAVALPDAASGTVVPMIRVLTYPQLLGSNVAYQTPGGQFEPAGYGFREVNVALLALGYSLGPSPDYASNYSFLRLRYDRPKREPVILFDLARVKARLAAGS